jgi:tRNA-Thr(GGU) m(6)t(6)A37 methyltransferase TsaA
MASQRTDTTRAVRGEIKERLRPIGVIRSDLKDFADAPKQGHEGAPDAWVDMYGLFVEGLAGIAAGDEVIIVTWLHKARREVLKVHPRDDEQRPLMGVFATRSQDRPNPLGLHTVTVKEARGIGCESGPSKPSMAHRS